MEATRQRARTKGLPEVQKPLLGHAAQEFCRKTIATSKKAKRCWPPKGLRSLISGNSHTAGSCAALSINANVVFR